ncbi:MAG: DUF1820 family protein [Sulfuricaulis sp.]|uniref:DUF1820 family protein n=1 Tax=Sulfuricaulis sp. TaxID=2003553 RepID=UPI0034A4898F
MKTRSIYRIRFHNQGDVYELYARKVSQSALYAFVEVEDILFGERSRVVVDPTEERLKTEFAGVKRVSIPVGSVVRIDEVEKEGVAKILPGDGETAKVKLFPLPATPPGRKP